MRVLGLDPGERRIGVALSDPGGTIALPHSVIDSGGDDVIAVIRAIVDEYDVGQIVVGFPVHLSGEEGPAARAARRFAEQIGEATGMSVVLQDERFTTVTAEAALLEGGVRRDKRKEIRDKVAAAVMLQGYLDTADDDGADSEP